MTAEQAVDVTSLLQLRQLQRPGKPDAVGRIVERFLEETDERMTALRGAVERSDAKVLEQAAHALKGIAGTVGANEMRDMAFGLEKMGRAGTTVGADQRLAELVDAFARARPTFEELQRGARS